MKHEIWTDGKLVETSEIPDPPEDALRKKARTAFDNNKAYLAGAPSTAEALAQVEALTRQINGLIKLVVDAGLVE